MNVYQVGGWVRDQLLGQTTKDRDWVVVGETPDSMLAQGFKPVGKDFPVFLHPTTHEEYALARTERKTGPGYKGFAFQSDPTITLEQDLSRRDLTINAIAMRADGQLIDPYQGQQDINNRLLRHVSEAFAEDPVRILRVARFYARFKHLGFSIAPETMVLMSNMVQQGEANHLVAERVWQELQLALSYQHPEAFIIALRDCGALAILFPEIDQLFGIPQSPKHHPEIDCGVHTLMVLEQATALSSSTMIRFAALTHDLGKAISKRPPWHQNHDTAGLPILKRLCQRYRIPKSTVRFAALAMQYHGVCHKIQTLPTDAILEMFEHFRAFNQPEQFLDFLIVCTADAKGRLGFAESDYPQAAIAKQYLDALLQIDLNPIKSENLSGKAFGDALRRLRLAKLKEIR